MRFSALKKKHLKRVRLEVKGCKHTHICLHLLAHRPNMGQVSFWEEKPLTDTDVTKALGPYTGQITQYTNFFGLKNALRN